MEEEDEIVASLPIHYSDHLHPNLHLHQFQLLSRPLLVPPSAAAAGKTIKARYKPKSGRYEIHVPNDVRPEVWDSAKGRDLGAARYEEDREEAAFHDVKFKEKDPREMRLNETRLVSERVPHAGAYVLGVVRDGEAISTRTNFLAMTHAIPQANCTCIQ
jgi:DNA-directed RNA polymerase-3 subunit RPC5